MAVNFGLIAQAPSFAQRFVEGQQAAAAEQDRNLLRKAQMEQMAAQRENMLAQRQDREAQAAARRAQEARAAQRQRLLTGAADALRQGGHTLNRDTLQQILASAIETDEPTLFQFATQTLKALDEEDLYKREATRFRLPGGAAPAAPSVMRQPAAAMPTAPAAPANLLAGTPYDIGVGAPAPTNALAAPPPAPATPTFTREQVQQMLTSPSARIREQGKALVATLEKPERPYEPTELEKLLTRQAQAAPGSPEARALQSRIDILTKREPKAPKEPDKPVEVVDPNDPTKTIIVSAQEAIAKRLTPAKAMEGLSPKEIQKREAAHPQATSSVKNFIAKSEQFIKELETLRDDPGLDSITGTVYGVTPGVISGEAGRRAMARYNKIFAKGGFQALQDLKAASQTGGALGNVSNEEGRRLESSTVGGLDRSQSLKDVQSGINDFIAEIRGSMQRVREAYDDTYEYRKTRRPGGAAPAGGRPSLDDIFK